MVAPDAVAALAVDAGADFVALRDRAPLDHAPVQHEAREAVLRVGHPQACAGERFEHPGVADLTTRLRVEGRAVEHDVDRRALADLRGARAVDNEPPDLRADRLVLLPPGELGGPGLLEQLPVELDRGVGPLAAGGGVRLSRAVPVARP